MQVDRFNELVAKTFEHCMEVLCVKQEQYAIEKDRLSQFKGAASFRNQTPKQVLSGFMLKHTTSIYDLIDKEATGETVGLGMWEEKITDHINYLVLLMGLVCDEEVKVEISDDPFTTGGKR